MILSLLISVYLGNPNYQLINNATGDLFENMRKEMENRNYTPTEIQAFITVAYPRLVHLIQEIVAFGAAKEQTISAMKEILCNQSFDIIKSELISDSGYRQLHVQVFNSLVHKI